MSSELTEVDIEPTERGTLWSSKNIPHSENFPNPYELIGDAYERISVADEWEIHDP